MKADEVKPKLKKVLLWFKTYWYIPVLAVLAIALLLVGKPTKWLFDLLEKKNDLHRREVESINKALEEERKAKEAAIKRYEETIKRIEEEYERKMGDLNDRKKKEIAKTVKKHQEDPDALAREVSNRFGFELVEVED